MTAPPCPRLEAELRFRAVLAEADLSPPDEALPHEDGVLFLWRDRRLALVIEVE